MVWLISVSRNKIVSVFQLFVFFWQQTESFLLDDNMKNILW